MNRVVSIISNLLFLKSVPDNQTLPILRFGRLHHFGSNHFNRVWPFIEEALPPVKTSIRVGNFIFAEMHTADSIPFTVSLTVLFKFDPESTTLSIAAQFVTLPSKVMLDIVKDYSDHALRQLIARYAAVEVLASEVRAKIQQELSRYLRLTLLPLGICVLPSDGLLLKELTPHERYRHNILSANKWDVTLETLATYDDPTFLERGIQGAMVDTIGNRPGDTNLVAPPFWPVFPSGTAEQPRPSSPSFRSTNGRSDEPIEPKPQE